MRWCSYHTRGHLGQARANTNALQSVVDGWLAEACIMLLLLLTFALANFGTATSRSECRRRHKLPVAHAIVNVFEVFQVGVRTRPAAQGTRAAQDKCFRLLTESTTTLQADGCQFRTTAASMKSPGHYLVSARRHLYVPVRSMGERFRLRATTEASTSLQHVTPQGKQGTLADR
eukprot:scaffold7335_cov417-Prasinococcus_capsulatus_cf.AAC.3